MQTYLVGGAVRDRLLGRLVKERDYLVVGATQQQMLELGFQQVGRDFPVFLHPETHEEYALARMASEGGKQLAPPMPQTSAEVTLEEDLARRDLTINAMAERDDGSLIDPYGGQADLERRLLRHVSPAFSDDPIRVLRVARLMAQLHPFGFQVVPETQRLMQQMVDSGALDNLVPERVWQELLRAISCDNPQPFFYTLRSCGALSCILPEIERLWGVPQPTHWHPEIDCGIHTMLALKAACRLSPSSAVRFATLTHDLGKGTTPPEFLPGHHGHEGRGVRLISDLCERLRVPRRYRLLAVQSARFHGHCHRLLELKPNSILRVLEEMDAFRRPERFAEYLLVCEADYRGRAGFADRAYPQAGYFWQFFQLAAGVDRRPLQGIAKGKAVGRKLHELRLQAMQVEKARLLFSTPST